LTREERAILSRDRPELLIPSTFPTPERFRPPAEVIKLALKPPSIVLEGILKAICPSVPFDVMIPFLYLRAGRFPFFVLNYFMDIQGPGLMSRKTRFYRSLHLIEAARKENVYPAWEESDDFKPSTATKSEEDGSNYIT